MKVKHNEKKFSKGVIIEVLRVLSDTCQMDKALMKGPGNIQHDVCNINRSGGILPKELSKSTHVGTRKMVNYA